MPALVSKETFHWQIADGSLWTSFRLLDGGEAGIDSWKIESATCNTIGGPQISANQLMSRYYLNPQPERIGHFLEDVSALGLFEKEGSIPPLVSFLTQVFRQNPERLNQWLNRVQSLPESHRHLVYQSLWKSDTAKSKEMLREYSPQHEPDKDKLREFATKVPVDLLTEAIESPSDLDELWAAFSATGNPHFVKRILSVFSWDNEASKSNHARTIILGAAKWSLSGQLKQHKVLRQICLDAMSEVDVNTRALLQEILSSNN